MSEFCSNCEKPSFIVNRKRMLCNECNHFRLHNETIQETQIKQQRKYQEKYNEKQSKKPPKQVTKVYVIKNSTKSESLQKNNLSKLKLQIREEAIFSNTYYCQGCGKGGEQLDCSHILSVKQRKDLELEKENINLLCRLCHIKWESGDIQLMLLLLTFEKDLYYIQSQDRRTFVSIITKLIGFINNEQQNKEDLKNKSRKFLEDFNQFI